MYCTSSSCSQSCLMVFIFIVCFLIFLQISCFLLELSHLLAARSSVSMWVFSHGVCSCEKILVHKLNYYFTVISWSRISGWACVQRQPILIPKHQVLQFCVQLWRLWHTQHKVSFGVFHWRNLRCPQQMQQTSLWNVYLSKRQGPHKVARGAVGKST